MNLARQLTARILHTVDWKFKVVGGVWWMGVREIPSTSPATLLGPISSRFGWQFPLGEPSVVGEMIRRVTGQTVDDATAASVSDMLMEQADFEATFDQKGGN